MRKRGLTKSRVGVVVKDKMHKSVIVEVTRTVKDPTYAKYVRKRTRFMVHDEDNACRVGEKVRIVETHPISRNKHWRVREKLS